MNLISPRFFPISIHGVCLLQTAHALNNTPVDEPQATVEKPISPFAFSLLPKAFQKKPVLAISVITEMTDDGRKIEAPTSKSPSYYYAYSMGYHEEGQGPAPKNKVSKEIMEKLAQKALASSGYLPGSREHPASLVLFFIWGVHSKLLENDLETGTGGFDDIGYKNLLSRAALVGGTAFAKELSRALDEQAMSGGPTVQIFDPVYRFTNRDDKTRDLMAQVMDDCYFVVISAYEGASLARGEKKLLWRTKMSTPAQGVSLAETTPALVASGGQFFGRDMTEAAIVGKRITRGGKVELGELEFKGYEENPTEKTNQTPPVKK